MPHSTFLSIFSDYHLFYKDSHWGPKMWPVVDSFLVWGPQFKSQHCTPKSNLIWTGASSIRTLHDPLSRSSPSLQCVAQRWSNCLESTAGFNRHHQISVGGSWSLTSRFSVPKQNVISGMPSSFKEQASNYNLLLPASSAIKCVWLKVITTATTGTEG